MKRAYMKPVFLAEAFEGTASVASCDYHSGAPGKEVLIYNGLRLCSGGNSCSHTVGGNKKDSGDVQEYWNYATENGLTAGPTSDDYIKGGVNGAYLFTGGQKVCDFVWNGGNSQVGIWIDNETDKNPISKAENRNPLNAVFDWISSFSDFFDIKGNGSNGHKPGVEGGGQFFS